MLFSAFKKLKKATPEDEAQLEKAMEENKVGFKDIFAMMVSAFAVIVLPCLLILLGLCAVAFLLLGLF